jgi:hypothetical protein
MLIPTTTVEYNAKESWEMLLSLCSELFTHTMVQKVLTGLTRYPTFHTRWFADEPPPLGIIE